MNMEYCFFIIAILIPRIFIYWKDSVGLKLLNIIRAMIVEVILMIPLFSQKSFAVLVPMLFVYHIFQYIVQRDGTSLLPKRILEFLFLILVSSFIFGVFLKDTTFNQSVIRFLQMIIGHCALFPEITLHSLKKAMIYFLGALLLVNEINNIIRYTLNLLKTEPLSKDRQQYTPDNQELNRGKIIGVLERSFFFFFVITNNYASIAFILAAKGFTRFKELDDKNFAEYVLIGTLLSSGLAISCAVAITKLAATIVK